jgi:UDP-N-acetylmuramyl pentapeptide phosphotransferase/UDP-N-acetylglucosamine-1-phosphate transferase
VIKAETEPKGQLVFVETLPWKILGSNISPKHMELALWPGRVGGVVAVIAFAIAMLGITDWGTWEYLAVILGSIGIFMVFFQTEAI